MSRQPSPSSALSDTDLQDDLVEWRQALGDIRTHYGDEGVSRILQGLTD